MSVLHIISHCLYARVGPVALHTSEQFHLGTLIDLVADQPTGVEWRAPAVSLEALVLVWSATPSVLDVN
jgi:hypothetical protein